MIVSYGIKETPIDNFVLNIFSFIDYALIVLFLYFSIINKTFNFKLWNFRIMKDS